MATPKETTALVALAPNQPLQLRKLRLNALQPDEVLVEIHASGICHTDLSVASGIMPNPWPIILGHEGAGKVLALGSSSNDPATETQVNEGDLVLLSFRSCGTCPQGCARGVPASCQRFHELNFLVQPRPDNSVRYAFISTDPASAGSSTDPSTATSRAGTATTRGPAGDHTSDKDGCFALFFGQSSFARHAIVHRSCLVKLPATASPRDLGLLAPLGCGFQTGAGTVINFLKARSGSSLVVFGAGGVGMAAIMGGALQGCSIIIAVDLNPTRLEMAKQVGATHLIKGGGTRQELVEAIKAVVADGIDYAVDTTGVSAVCGAMVDALAFSGRAVIVAGAKPDAMLEINMFHFLLGQKQLHACIEGASKPSDQKKLTQTGTKFVPYLIEQYYAGRFPIDKLTRFYQLSEFEQAFEDAKSGKAIKPVLLFS